MVKITVYLPKSVVPEIEKSTEVNFSDSKRILSVRSKKAPSHATVSSPTFLPGPLWHPSLYLTSFALHRTSNGNTAISTF